MLLSGQDARSPGLVLVCALALSLGNADDGSAGAAKEKAKHVNRLAKETSPYLLMHAHNPDQLVCVGAGSIRESSQGKEDRFPVRSATTRATGAT